MTADGTLGVPAGDAAPAGGSAPGDDVAAAVDGLPEHDPGDPATGHSAIDAAVRDLAALRDAPPAEQLPAFQAVHRTLQEALASIDQQ